MHLKWQLEEYWRVSLMLVKLIIANESRKEIVREKFSFGRNAQQYILFFYPREKSARKKLLIFFLHGGGWGHGNPGMFSFIGRFFAEAGYPVILGGYRLAPRYKFPKQLDDTYAGLKAGMQLAAKRGLPTDKIVLAGQSAGAQLASLMLLDRISLHKNQLNQNDFCGLLLISGLLDFWYCQNKKDLIMLKNYLGKPSRWPSADPIRYVQGDEAVPVLCLHGEEDLLVDKANSISFVKKINQKDRRIAELYLVDGQHHSDLTMMFLYKLPATEKLLRWLNEVEQK